MRTLQLTIVALLAIHAAAHAQTSPTAADRAFTSRFMDSFTPGKGPQSSDRIVRDANGCAPDVASAVWGRNGSLLGYSCTAASAN
ncbi:MAG: hypothetical protein ABSG83_01260 [Roseiarcus sp.]|jgi:hypothetical protein